MFLPTRIRLDSRSHDIVSNRNYMSVLQIITALFTPLYIYSTCIILIIITATIIAFFKRKFPLIIVL